MDEWKLTNQELARLNETGGSVVAAQAAKKRAYIEAGKIILNPDALQELYEACERVLFITHNEGVGLKGITGKEDGTNRVVFTPSQLNEIGDLLIQALAKAEGK